MDAERWQRLSPMLDALLELDAPTRARSLALTREEDPVLADELEQLLALEEDNDEFLDTPLVAPVGGPRPGVDIGPYRLLHMLGEGGMGQVWLASRADGLYQKRVALKLLRPGLADPNLRLRFTRERQILARLEHVYIARLFDAGISADGQPYLALEYVEGEPITTWCRMREASLELRLELFGQVCAAVSHAHANLIVHRDLKPSNVLVTALDEVRLLDFGIAKLLDGGSDSPEHTRTEQRAFTLHYAAPEQILGEPVSTMTDVYSLGVILYELLTGAKPYRPKRNSDAQWEEAVLHQDATRPSTLLLRSADEAPARDVAARRRRDARRIGGDLDNIVLKAMAKKPEQRYPSVEALALDLRRYREGKPVHARAQSLRYRIGKYMHRHRWALSTGALALLVVGLALAVVGWQAREAVREAGRAQAMQDFVIGLFEQAGTSGDAQGAAGLSALLDAADASGVRALHGQPLAQAELFGVIARLRLGLDDPVQALVVLDRQAALLRELPDAVPQLRLAAALDRARAQLQLGQPGACVQTLEASGSSQRNASPPQLSDLSLQLGRCLAATGDADRARTQFRRALQLRRSTLGEDAGTVEVMMEQASLDARTDPERALAGYRDAMARLRALGEQRDPLEVELEYRSAEALYALGQTDAAHAATEHASRVAAQMYGPQHPLRLRLEELRDQLEAARPPVQ